MNIQFEESPSVVLHLNSFHIMFVGDRSLTGEIPSEIGLLSSIETLDFSK